MKKKHSSNISDITPLLILSPIEVELYMNNYYK